MTKAEQAAMAAVQNELAAFYAMARPPGIEPEKTVLPPKHDEPARAGWYSYPVRAETGRVERGWTLCNLHGSGDVPAGYPQHASRDGVPLYATERDALIALRYEARAQFAEALMKIDRMIEDAA